MLLWKATFSSDSDHAPNNLSSNLKEPWKEWPRPPGGFLDLGYAFSILEWVNSHILSDVEMVF
jgi:tRNASer (uridine44-2'-O)-methyltransferase